MGAKLWYDLSDENNWHAKMAELAKGVLNLSCSFFLHHCPLLLFPKQFSPYDHLNANSNWWLWKRKYTKFTPKHIHASCFYYSKSSKTTCHMEPNRYILFLFFSFFLAKHFLSIIKEVHEWMKQEKLEHHFETLAQNGFNGPALAELKFHSLNQPTYFEHICEKLGIVKTGEILQFSGAIRRL